jgi:hypothetical protein
VYSAHIQNVATRSISDYQQLTPPDTAAKLLARFEYFCFETERRMMDRQIKRLKAKHKLILN